MVRQLAWDVHGRHLAANLNDRTVRTLDVAMRDAPPRFVARHKFQDMVSRTPWSGVGFSHDGEYVMGGAAQDAAHHIYLWDRDAGVLVKILEGPREPLILAAWHPSKPQLASIASSGDVHLWSTTTTENWSAYAPGFEELEKNVEYEERENEFDMVRVSPHRRTISTSWTGSVRMMRPARSTYLTTDLCLCRRCRPSEPWWTCAVRTLRWRLSWPLNPNQTPMWTTTTKSDS